MSNPAQNNTKEHSCYSQIFQNLVDIAQAHFVQWVIISMGCFVLMAILSLLDARNIIMDLRTVVGRLENASVTAHKLNICISMMQQMSTNMTK
jgi:hypothetical protein